MLGLILFTMVSCQKDDDACGCSPEPADAPARVLNDYEIWYVDYNRTTGSGEVPFMANAFTLSFTGVGQGDLYANNNIAGIGYTGDGYGISVGTYHTGNSTLYIEHDIDGSYTFEVIRDSESHIRLYCASEHVTYYLYGYDRDDFDYDRLYYDNIEYLLQEYSLWRKTYTSAEGYVNAFDDENFLRFTPEGGLTFYSSLDGTYTDSAYVQWNFTGTYQVEDIEGYDDLKVLVLEYQNGDTEEFEMQIDDDAHITLYHYGSGTTYAFTGEGLILYKNASAPHSKRKLIKRKKRKRRKHLSGVPLKKNNAN